MKLSRLILLLVAALALAACGRPAAPARAETTTQEVHRAADRAATVPAATPTLPAPAASRPGPFTVGLPIGNAYGPSSLALDASRNLAYVYHWTSDSGPAVVAVVDLAGGQVTRQMPVGDKPLGSGRLLLTPDGARLFLQESGGQALWTMDAQTGAAKRVLDRVRDIAINDNGKLLFAAREGGLAAYATADLAAGKVFPAWESKSSFSRVAVNGGRVLAGSYTMNRAMVVFDALTGSSLVTAAAPDVLNAIAPGPEGSWAAVVGGERPRLIRYNRALEALGETVIPYASEAAYDAPGNRFLLGGARSEGSGWNTRGYGVTVAVDARDGKVTQETRWPGPNAPTSFARWNATVVLAFQSGGPGRLELLDPDTFAAHAHIVMGARVDDVVVDGNRTVFAADDLGRIHALRLPDGGEVARWAGAAPLAFDAANGRLYANRNGRVVSLDARTGNLVTEFPQGGAPAPDPQRNLVYIADRGVTLYDRTGKRLGELASTFPDPQGFSPNPYAYAARVNPITGHVAVIFHNGIPGSNGGSFLRIYEPRSDVYIEPRAPHSFVMDVISDSKGNWYVAYSPARNQEAVQSLTADGRELRRLDHRTGLLALDERNDDLYLVSEGRVTRVAATTLTALEARAGPETLGGLAFSPATATAYLFNRNSPEIRRIALADLAALNLKPVAANPRPDSSSYGLAVTAVGKQRVLVGQFDEPYRTFDGKAWQRLLPDLGLQYANITATGDGAIFINGRSAWGGEGVWRSRDGGDTWEWLTGGLTDLAADGPLLAGGADDAYFLNRGQGLLRWDGGQRTWRLATPRDEGKEWSNFALAPDGVLFRSNSGNLERSDDQGATWKTLGPTQKTGDVIGFSALYTVTQTIFSAARVDYRIAAVQRSTDGGKTWQPSLASSQIALDGMVPQVATGFGRAYLLTRPNSGEAALLRTTDYGETWQFAPADTAKGATSVAVDPLDGRLWLAVKGGVRSVDPNKLRWQALRAPVAATNRAAATPASAPVATPTAGPCARTLSDADAEIDGRGLGLGCPRESLATISAARQKFQNGQMIWRGDRAWIYVLYDDGTWEGFSDLWKEGSPADDPALVAPAGLQQPVRGFGKVWRENLGGPNARLGWALDKEQGVEAQAQDWDYGTVLRFGGEVIILQAIGTWR